MPDSKKKSGPPDSKRINVNEEHEVQYWTKTLGITKEELIKTVEEVGTSVEAVRKAFGPK
ncbi:MAG: DUF3606 domain-containing protein [Ferruginibacter sp.]|nr:DUF3606 domain-containing protein [Ferruginibacter sp.]